MCAAHVLSLTAFSTYPSLLPRLQKEWGLSNAEAGFISGALFAGYMSAVPLLTALTDRLDARRVYLAASLCSATGALGFAAFAQGMASAAFFQVLAGVGVAGTYMPGLKALTDAVGTAHSRPVSYYTATFGVGLALSIWLAGAFGDAFGWREAFAWAAVGPAVAGAMVIWRIPAGEPERGVAKVGVIHGFRRTLSNRNVRPYLASYVAHCWELFGSRSWMVAFLSFAQGASAWGLSPVSIAAIGNLFSPPASVIGNEIAMRVGRGTVIRTVMGASALITCALGFLSALPWPALAALIFLHMWMVNGDSSSITAGVVAAAEPGLRGTTMAVHATFGFAAGFAAPLIFGTALDWAGGRAAPLAWGVAFVTLGALGLLAALVLRPGARA